MTVAEEIDKLQKEIDSAKKNAAIFEGRLQEGTRRLKEEFGLDSAEEAQKEVDDLQLKINSLETSIQTKITKLKETYSW